MEIVGGFLIALAIGMTGIGAGSVTAPVLILFFGVSAPDAVTAALVFGTIVKLVATPFYFARKQINFKVLGYLAAGGLPTVLLGSLALRSLDKASLTAPILAIVGATVIVSAGATLWRSLHPAALTRTVSQKWLPWFVAPIGFEVGFSSAGAGALGTVLLMRCTELLPAEVVGTDLAFGLLLSLFGGGVHASMNGISWPVVTQLLIGGIPGVLIGTQLATVLSPRKMRLALCVWLIYIGCQLSYRGVSGLWQPPAISSLTAHNQNLK